MAKLDLDVSRLEPFDCDRTAGIATGWQTGCDPLNCILTGWASLRQNRRGAYFCIVQVLESKKYFSL